MKEHSAQYTIRGLPLEVDRILRERAKASKTSINQIIISELTKATIGRKQLADFSDLVGQWKQDEEFDRVLALHRVIHPDEWS